MRGKALFLATLVLLLQSGVATARELSFAERVEAQRAIERVRHSHRIGTKRSFEQTVTDDVLEQMVRTYLQQSAVLERVWHVPVTARALDRELQRIAASTLQPERLQEIYAALHHDAFLLRECFARATLVERLTGEFAGDPRFANERRAAWWKGVTAGIDVASVPAVAREDGALPMPGTGSGGRSCSAGDAWINGSLVDGAPSERGLHRAVWTGSEMIVWGGRNWTGHPTDGGRYDPLTDTWKRVTGEGAPGGRQKHTAVWTGEEMIVWGGFTGGGSSPTATGGRYDPVTDTWTATSTVDAPEARHSHGAVWTGNEMIVWGGGSTSGYLDSGARYDPASDTWDDLSTVDVPPASAGFNALWTGTEMLVLGGWPATAGRFDPASDAWSPVATENADLNEYHTAVWTGTEAIVWGHNPLMGARYDPGSDTWTPISVVGSPSNRKNHAAIWTGEEMIIWGGGFSPGADFTILLRDGGRYDPVTDTWTPISDEGAPSGRVRPAAVWTGELLIVWGGDKDYGATGDLQGYFDTGGRYDPQGDSWTPTSLGGGPAGNEGHSAVWTGNEMIVWGGESEGALVDTGKRYDPVTDTWSATSAVGAPSPRRNHSAVWADDEMIVWGGYGVPGPDAEVLDTGARYDPSTDAWSPTTTVGAPAPRARQTAVWTGREMIVWGGFSDQSGGTVFGSGGRYDPAIDGWSPTSMTGAPTARWRHSAVWTGAEMIVWGGTDAGMSVGLGTGARYDPDADSWSPTSTLQAPAGRYGHTGVWTGGEMIVWGGNIGGVGARSGARYDPDSNFWVPTPVTGAPAGRWRHSAVWTGDEMVVWGGMGEEDSTGGGFDPVEQAWSPTSTVDAPQGADDPTAVWTGELMIVWGGGSSKGGRYLVEASTDADADGHCSFADCDDGNGQVWAPVGEARDLVFLDSETLGWSPPLDPGGTVVVYDVLRAGGPDQFATSGFCVEQDDGSDTEAVDPSLPGSGDVLCYLARAQNACPLGGGTLGTDSSGNLRSGPDCP